MVSEDVGYIAVSADYRHRRSKLAEMVSSSGAQRNTSRWQPYGWLGAGAIALGVGVALAGAGTAHADDGVNDAASAAATSSTRAPGNAAAGAATKSTPRSPVATSRATRPRHSVNDGVGKRALSAANRSTPAVTPQVTSVVPVSAAASASAGKSSARARAVRVAVPASPVQDPAAASATAGLVLATRPGAGDRPLRGAVVRAVASAPASTQLAVNPAEAINAAVVDWFDSTSASLATLPRGPLNELASGALLLVRRTLFNQLPTADPLRLFSSESEQLSGSLGATDPEGDALNYQVVTAPQFGALQISQDGVYTYTPGPARDGIDSFTVAVSDRGFNLVDPFSTRATLVTGTIASSDGGLVAGLFEQFQLTVKNLTGSPQSGIANGDSRTEMGSAPTLSVGSLTFEGGYLFLLGPFIKPGILEGDRFLLGCRDGCVFFGEVPEPGWFDRALIWFSLKETPPPSYGWVKDAGFRSVEYERMPDEMLPNFGGVPVKTWVVTVTVR